MASPAARAARGAPPGASLAAAPAARPPLSPARKLLQRRLYDACADAVRVRFALALLACAAAGAAAALGAAALGAAPAAAWGALLLARGRCAGALDNIGGVDASGRLCHEPIDAVYTWVNGSDPQWFALMRRYRAAADAAAAAAAAGGAPAEGGDDAGDGGGSDRRSGGGAALDGGAAGAAGAAPAGGSSSSSAAANLTAAAAAAAAALELNRYRDNDELRYSVRSLFKYAPWLRSIVFVTNGQVPAWLDTSHPRVRVVTHAEIFPDAAHLPTFSSPAIEAHLHRIPGLSRRFVYFNDDVMLGAATWPDDFVMPGTGQKVYLAWEVPKCAPGCVDSWPGDGFCDAACNVARCAWDGGDCVNNTKSRGGGGASGTASFSRGSHKYDHAATAAAGSSTAAAWSPPAPSPSPAPRPCAPGCPDAWLGDATCDAACAGGACGADAGDCGVTALLSSEGRGAGGREHEGGDVDAGADDAGADAGAGTDAGASAARVTTTAVLDASVDWEAWDAATAAAVAAQSAAAAAELAAAAQAGGNATAAASSGGAAAVAGGATATAGEPDAAPGEPARLPALRCRLSPAGPLALAPNASLVVVNVTAAAADARRAVAERIARVGGGGGDGGAWAAAGHYAPATAEVGGALEALRAGALLPSAGLVALVLVAEHVGALLAQPAPPGSPPPPATAAAGNASAVNATAAAVALTQRPPPPTLTLPLWVRLAWVEDACAGAADARADDGARNATASCSAAAAGEWAHVELEISVLLVAADAAADASTVAGAGQEAGGSGGALTASPSRRLRAVGRSASAAAPTLTPWARARRAAAASVRGVAGEPAAFAAELRAAWAAAKRAAAAAGALVGGAGAAGGAASLPGAPPPPALAAAALDTDVLASAAAVASWSDGGGGDDGGGGAAPPPPPAAPAAAGAGAAVPLRLRAGGRALGDAYGDALLTSNRLITGAFGRRAGRRVPAHMPHLIDARAMAALQARFPAEFAATSARRFRDGADVQYAFLYMWFLLEGGASGGLDAGAFFAAELDADGDGALSPNELRTLAAVVHRRAPTAEEIRAIEACVAPPPPRRSGSGRGRGRARAVEAPDGGVAYEAAPEEEEDGEGAGAGAGAGAGGGEDVVGDGGAAGAARGVRVTWARVRDCPAALDGLARHAKSPPGATEVHNSEDVAFEMVTDDFNKTRAQLDAIRGRRPKFVCVNDDMRDAPAPVRALLADFYASFVPRRAPVELPPGRANPEGVYVDALRERVAAAARRRALAWAVGAPLALALGVAFARDACAR